MTQWEYFLKSWQLDAERDFADSDEHIAEIDKQRLELMHAVAEEDWYKAMVQSNTKPLPDPKDIKFDGFTF